MSQTPSQETAEQTNIASCNGCAILIDALLDLTRSNRRARLAEVAALERLEKLLTIQRASLADDEQAPRSVNAAPTAPV
jgi:hypothetical protein